MPGIEGDVTIFEGALEALVQDVSGPIGKFLLNVMEETILPLATDALSVPAVRATTQNARQTLVQMHQDHPDIPPRSRTGALRDSLEAVGPLIDERGLCAYGVATATRDGFSYPNYLRTQDWRFLPPGDPRFTYIDVP